MDILTKKNQIYKANALIFISNGHFALNLKLLLSSQ